MEITANQSAANDFKNQLDALRSRLASNPMSYSGKTTEHSPNASSTQWDDWAKWSNWVQWDNWNNWNNWSNY